MSANAAVTSAEVKTTTDSSNMLNTDHPFWQIIRTVPDFPKVGIDFYDITPLLRSHINAVIDEMLAVLPKGLLDEVDCLGAVEARGFVFASLLAGRLGKGMILLRKPGKLPPPVANKAYALEYGKDTLEMQNNLPPERVLLVDDILATGANYRMLCRFTQLISGHQRAACRQDIVDQ